MSHFSKGVILELNAALVALQKILANVLSVVAWENITILMPTVKKQGKGQKKKQMDHVVECKTKKIMCKKAHRRVEGWVICFSLRCMFVDRLLRLLFRLSRSPDLQTYFPWWEGSHQIDSFCNFSYYCQEESECTCSFDAGSSSCMILEAFG